VRTSAPFACAIVGIALVFGDPGPVGCPGPEGRSRIEADDLLVANLQGGHVTWLDGRSGALLGCLSAEGAGEIRGGTGIAFGPDGDLYVGSSRNDRILRFDGSTGEFIGLFVEDGELASPFSLVFGPDGDLYVTSGTGDRVLRYDGHTASFLGVAASGGGLERPIGLAFGPSDRMLYVANVRGRDVLRFDPASGRFLGVFASDSLRFPSDLAFGPEGDLYVSSAGSGTVIRFDGSTGTFVEIYARLPGKGGVPMGLAFLPAGDLAIGDFGRNRIYRVPSGGGEPTLLSDEGLRRPENLAVKPPP